MDWKDIIEKAIKEARGKRPGIIISRDDIYNAIFKAGIKEVVEWGNEPCPHIQELLKRDCDMCRQVKLKVWGITASE